MSVHYRDMCKCFGILVICLVTLGHGQRAFSQEKVFTVYPSLLSFSSFLDSSEPYCADFKNRFLDEERQGALDLFNSSTVTSSAIVSALSLEGVADFKIMPPYSLNPDTVINTLEKILVQTNPSDAKLKRSIEILKQYTIAAKNYFHKSVNEAEKISNRKVCSISNASLVLHLIETYDYATPSYFKKEDFNYALEVYIRNEIIKKQPYSELDIIVLMAPRDLASTKSSDFIVDVLFSPDKRMDEKVEIFKFIATTRGRVFTDSAITVGARSGASSTFSEGNQQFRRSIVLGQTSSPVDVNGVKEVFFHELGHYFGLYHVFTTIQPVEKRSEFDPIYNKACNSVPPLSEGDATTLLQSGFDSVKIKSVCECFFGESGNFEDEDGAFSQVNDTPLVLFIEVDQGNANSFNLDRLCKENSTKYKDHPFVDIGSIRENLMTYSPVNIKRHILTPDQKKMISRMVNEMK